MTFDELRQLEVLRVIAETEDDVDETYLQKEVSVPPEMLFSALHALCSREYLSADFSITAYGMEALAPFRVDNAVILAAGLGTRIAPFSRVKPKGLITVKGEVLIERQIRQLITAGIHDIIVVVGYKKEQFLYLEDLYDVKLIFNAEYDVKNTHASLYCARDFLKNTYICNADNYYPMSLFHRYEFRPYYTLEYKTDHPASDKAVKDGLITDERGLIVDASHPECNKWVSGFAYFDRRFSDRFAGLLSDNYDKQGCDNFYWEQVYAAHVSELALYKQVYSGGRIKEFDTPMDLVKFDPDVIRENHL